MTKVSKRKKSTTEKGELFVNQVAELFRLMGYEVHPNFGVLGHQIDLLLTYKMPSGLSIKTAIECKYVEKGNLKKNDCMENINALVDLKRNDEAQSLIIITTNGFAKDICYTAKANKIALLTISDLRADTIDVESYIDRIIYDFEHWEEYKEGQRKPIIELFERANLFEHYVNLRCRDSNDRIYDPIDKYIQDWIQKDDKNHITLLGDYGTGKSSFLLYLTYIFAKTYKKDHSSPIPIFISLKNLIKIDDIKKMIFKILTTDYNIKIHSMAYFLKLIEDGKVILLLDGFDEMESKSNKDIILKNFEEINKLVSKKSKVILTSRTHYFKTHSQVKDIFNPQYDTDLLKMIRGNPKFEIIELLEFNNNQIIEFLSRHREDYMEMWLKIQSTYNLEDLSKRPILLEMIMRSLPDLMSSGKDINSSELYNVYTNIWIKRDDWRSKMKSDEKSIFIEELALHLFLNNIQSVHHTELYEIVINHFKRVIRSKDDADIFDTDTRNCSFLNRDHDGNYKFIHKSFMEFFVAKKFFNEINNNNIKYFKLKPLTPEITDFLSKMSIDKNRLYNVINLTRKSKFDEVKYMGGNALSVLKSIGETFTDKDFSNTILRNADFENSTCDKSNFSGAELQYSNFIDASLLYTDFCNSNLEGAVIEDIGNISSLTYDDKNENMAFGTVTGYVIIVDLKSFKKTQVIKETNHCIKKLKFFNNDKYLGVYDSSKLIYVFSMASFGQCIYKDVSPYEWVDFHSVKPELLLLGVDSLIKILDIDRNIEKYINVKLDTITYSQVGYINDERFALISVKNDVFIFNYLKSNVIKKIKSKLERIDSIEYEKGSNSIYLNQSIQTSFYESGDSQENDTITFCWDKVPGSDTSKLQQLLKQKFSLDWVDKSKIEKVDGNRTIIFTNHFSYLVLKMNTENTKVFLRIDDGRTAELEVKNNNNELIVSIYKNYACNNKYEIINLNNFETQMIDAGLLGVISKKADIMLAIDGTQQSGYLFKIIKVSDKSILKESYNSSLVMTFTKNSLSDNDSNNNHNSPCIVFSKDESQSIYISDYSGKLIWWNWAKEPSLKSKEKRQKWRGEWRVVSISKTMLKSKFINENMFKCNFMNIHNVMGLSKEQIQALKRSGAITDKSN